MGPERTAHRRSAPGSRRERPVHPPHGAKVVTTRSTGPCRLISRVRRAPQPPGSAPLRPAGSAAARQAGARVNRIRPALGLPEPDRIAVQISSGASSTWVACYDT